MPEVYSVLLYPPIGRPRVISLPATPKGMKYPFKTFKARVSAEKALEAFFEQNPEYRNWKDGTLPTSV